MDDKTLINDAYEFVSNIGWWFALDGLKEGITIIHQLHWTRQWRVVDFNLEKLAHLPPIYKPFICLSCHLYFVFHQPHNIQLPRLCFWVNQIMGHVFFVFHVCFVDMMKLMENVESFILHKCRRTIVGCCLPNDTSIHHNTTSSCSTRVILPVNIWLTFNHSFSC